MKGRESSASLTGIVGGVGLFGLPPAKHRSSGQMCWVAVVCEDLLKVAEF